MGVASAAGEGGRLPTYFLSHGGGPWSYMDGPGRQSYAELERSLVAMRPELKSRVRAILMISGHWEEMGFAISSAARPEMLYDYGGFPDYLYRIRYAAPGSPALAARVQGLLAAGNISARLDDQRGFDHGTFSIMHVLAPEEDLPIVQLSMDSRMDPALHLQVGRLLAPLRTEGVLIVGSGFSFHNFFIREARAGDSSATFDDWLQHALINAKPAERTQLLIRWEGAPFARAAHPHEDHLIPLMVAVGAAEEEQAQCTYHQTDFWNHHTVSSFRFGA
jgi:aromatic ring-opening dioxygenase catalytic subunit (LigB family)